MIEVDISNIWGDISLPDLLGLERDVFQGHLALTENACPEWMALPGEGDCAGILDTAEEIRACSDILVVIGGDGFPRGVIELLAGAEMGLRILFVEGSLSTRSRNALLHQLEGKDFSLCVCSDALPGDCLALRELKWLLERRCGTDEAHSRIHSDPWGLAAMAAAGVDIRALLQGAAEAREAFDLRSYDNPAWLHAASRHLMGRKGRNVEMLISSEPEFSGFGRWWQRVAGGCGFPVSAPLTGESALPADGRSCFAVMLRFDPPEQKAVISESVQDPGGLNFLAGRTLDQVEDAAWEAALEAHADAGIPAVSIQCGGLREETLGQLFWFFRLSCGICACMPGAEPAREPVLRDLLRLLGKPGC